MDTVPVLHALAQQPHLWNANTVRTANPRSNHRTADDIVLRYNPVSEGDDFLDKVCSRIEVTNYVAWDLLPQVRPFVFGLMSRVEGLHLGRVVISRVRPGGIIPPHSDRILEAEAAFPDRIPPVDYYSRYHVVLQSFPGTIFRSGDEQVYMATGEAWWFDNKLEHEVVNNSADDRIHLIIDIHTGQ